MTLRGPIAIVGLAGRFPGSTSPEGLFADVVAGRSRLAPIPDARGGAIARDRGANRHGVPDTLVSPMAGLLDAIPVADLADRLALPGLTLERLRGLDPLVHLVLRVGVDAFDDAAIAPDPDRFGVIFGNIALPTDGANRWVAAVAAGDDSAEPLDAFVTGLPVGLLAHAVGARAGGYSLDAACASSLYAVALGCADLRAGRLDAVLVGGASRPDCLYTSIGFSQLHALSPSGVCAPFTAGADGLLVGEGAGAFLLKRLEDARRDGDTIRAVILGEGLSNDRGGSLLSPDSEGQGRALRAAYASAGVDPGSVDLLECHGTGTARGDQVELESLAALRRGGAAPVVGSVKSNVGHLLTAAGAAGLCKVVLALEEAVLPPSAGLTRHTAGAGLAAGPFRVLDVAEPWPAPPAEGPRRAGVSGFGFGGINAHVVIEEWREPREPREPQPREPRELQRPSEFEEPREARTRGPLPALAVVGLAAQIGAHRTLAALVPSLLYGTGSAPPQPMGVLTVPWGRFALPPRQIPTVLPQHLLALTAAADAVADAGTAWAGGGPRAGCIVAANLDLRTAAFAPRWRPGAESSGVSPPLDGDRTQGALGGLIASRIARELDLGGPSFWVSAEDGSSLRALDVACNLLRDGVLDRVVVVAVELGCDPALRAAKERLRGGPADGPPRPFEPGSEGAGPADGAVAIVLIRADAPEAVGHAHAVLCAIGAAHAAPLSAAGLGEAVRAAGLAAFARAARPPSVVGLVEARGTGTAAEDAADLSGLLALYGAEGAPRVALGAVSATVGDLGAASGLLSVVRACLSLHARVLPPTPRFVHQPLLVGSALHVPPRPQPFLRDRHAGPRGAAVVDHGLDGSVLHALLLEAEAPLRRASGPGMPRDCGLFLLEGDDGGVLASVARRLLRQLDRENEGVAEAAARWLHDGGGRPSPANGHTPGRRALVAGSVPELRARLEEVLRGDTSPVRPQEGGIAWVFPGSGNHFLGMGRDLLLAFPEVAESLDRDSAALRSQLVPAAFAPLRADWRAGWEEDALLAAEAVPSEVIFAQVAHGITVARVLSSLGVDPDAVLGYSLGESAGLLATGAWPERDLLHQRVLASPLFGTELVGEQRVFRARSGHGDWCAAVLPVSAEAARRRLTPGLDLLIVNAPDECVVGGRRREVLACAEALAVRARVLSSVPTVHCAVVEPVADAYRSLHRQPTVAPRGVRFYSGAAGAAYSLDSEAAADSILANALHGLDWPRTVSAAWDDGVRIFVECGPQGSCTRMIDSILVGRPHLAISACKRGRTALLNLYEALGALWEAGVPVDLERLMPALSPLPAPPSGTEVHVHPPGPEVPAVSAVSQSVSAVSQSVAAVSHGVAAVSQSGSTVSPVSPVSPAVSSWGSLLSGLGALTAAPLRSAAATAVAHAAFLRVAEGQQRLAVGALTRLQTALLAAPRLPIPGITAAALPRSDEATALIPRFDRAACLDFARGSVVSTYGPGRAHVDRYPTRVRLPDEPLMLVDRILSVDGPPGSLGPGRVVTEHDVLQGAWYLDGERAPVCITVEAGQADLFLSGWLGIDDETRGERVYRLLDAEVVFHRDLPAPGETIRYDIQIERFLRQGQTWLFFFRYEGSIGDQHLISMRSGCAGFFSPGQLAQGKGLVERRGALPPSRRLDPTGCATAPCSPLLPPPDTTTLDEAGVERLRAGDLSVFGPAFAGLSVHPALRLPGGRMNLVHRVTGLDLTGGRYGLGHVASCWDVDPLGWSLVCHFSDDRVMPGTLMYEGCLHTLRVLLLALGWGCADLEGPVPHGAPIPEIPSRLRCRGQVIDRTRTLEYRIDVKERGYDPEPYVLADAVMLADGREIVEFENVSYRLVGLDEGRIQRGLERGDRGPSGPPDRSPFGPPRPGKPVLFSRDRVLAYAVGAPSRAFGPRYAPFDADRRLARLPGPPLMFIDRLTEVAPPPWELRAGGFIEAEYDVPPDAYYFAANGQRSMPFFVLLEVALQPCGWLAAWLGSALRSEEDLHFRNLDGQAVLHGEIGPDVGTLTTRVRMTGCSEAAGMILQEFEFQLWGRGRVLYEGTTGFGFFPARALANQVGVRGAHPGIFHAPDLPAPPEVVPRFAPWTPADGPLPAPPLATGLTHPARAISMLDRIDAYLPTGGPQGLGWIRGSKDVDADDWFFAAHFFQDPVIPGSLGLEAFLQLLRIVAERLFGQEIARSHRLQPVAVGVRHRWTYRGQVVPSNRVETVEACITAVHGGACPSISADGCLRVDGRVIYAMSGFTLRLVPNEQPLHTDDTP